MTIVALNSHVSVDLFEISSRTRSKRLPLYWEQRLISTLRRSEAILEPITSIGYVSNKRGFSVKTQDKTYFVRILFPSNLPIPYIIRRAIGQPDCCARAHTLNQNLAMRSTDRTSEHAIKYGYFYSMNLLPCRTCFDNYTTHEYLDMCKNNRLSDFSDADPKEFLQYTNFVLIWLCATDNIEQLIDMNDTELFDNYRIAHIKSINKYFRSIAQYCRSVIDTVEVGHNDVATLSAVTELQVIMNSCLDICGDINDRPLGAISIDKCYGYSEYMSRYRQNAQNVAFALRYSGVECQVIHDEEEMLN